jgi:hypothetical protein
MTESEYMTVANLHRARTAFEQIAGMHGARFTDKAQVLKIMDGWLQSLHLEIERQATESNYCTFAMTATLRSRARTLTAGGGTRTPRARGGCAALKRLAFRCMGHLGKRIE